jgi:pilus assembly protein Flp/PilA
MTKFAHFLKDESGATAIEYGLIASLIAIAVIAGASALGNSLSSSFNYIKSQIKTS